MLFLEIRRAACAAAAASALFVINGSVAACEDEYYPAAPTKVPQETPYAEEIPDPVEAPVEVEIPVGVPVPVPVGVGVGVGASDAQIAAIMQADHQTVLDMMEAQLIPTALNPGVLYLLLSVQPVIAAHLVEAGEIPATLGAPR